MLNRISKDDWQYLIPFLLCAICFVATDVLDLFDKTNIAYWSGRLLFEPYRVITSHFFHGDASHLLANTSGIIISRYFLKALGLKNNYFFLVLVILLIPIQSLISWLLDIFIFQKPMSLAIGFSGVLYGVDSFMLLTTIFGKKNFVGFNCALESNYKVLKSILVLTGIGMVWSLLPGISFVGHLSGFIAGLIVFLF